MKKGFIDIMVHSKSALEENFYPSGDTMDYGVVDDDQNVVGTIQFLPSPSHFKHLWNSNQITEEKKVNLIYMHLKSFNF